MSAPPPSCAPPRGDAGAAATAGGFERRLARHGAAPLRRGLVTTLQLNIGWRCNLACHHCHVESGPKRTEAMGRPGAERVLALLAANPSIELLDITGGAPEMNPHFRFVVEGARALGRRVLDRCNLTIFYEPGYGDLPDFLARNRVEVVASLPCYTRENVDGQRGRGVFDGSIEALRWLNRLGYGQPESPLRLDLVYNPQGPTLPPDQSELEARYREELRALFGIEFHHLRAIANMPIRRFARELERSGRHAEYMALLAERFNPHTIPGLMCRNTLSVAHDGRIYDCDFNQMLELGTPGPERSIWDVEDLSALTERPIATGSHCFGCTAGAGSSCAGALA